MRDILTAYFLSVIFLGCNVFLLNQPQIIAQTIEAKSYVCGKNHGLPTTMAVRQDNRQKPLIQWVSSLGGLNPEQRCELVSKRFNDLMSEGGLQIFTPGTFQGSYVICAVGAVGLACKPNLVLFTVKSELEARDVADALRKLGAHLRGPIEQSDRIYTYFDLADYVASDKNEEFEKPLLGKI